MTEEGFVREDYHVKNLLLSGRLSGLGDHVCETFARKMNQDETTIMVLPFLPARARRQIHTLCSSMNLWHATIARHVEQDRTRKEGESDECWLGGGARLIAFMCMEYRSEI